MPRESGYSLVVLVLEVKLERKKNESQAKWMQWCRRRFKEQRSCFISMSPDGLMRKKTNPVIENLPPSLSVSPIVPRCKSLAFWIWCTQVNTSGNVNNVVATNCSWWHTARNFFFKSRMTWLDKISSKLKKKKIAANNVVMSVYCFSNLKC